MIILGISDNHDSGACLLRDGQILSAINEERLTRQKLQGGFPHLSIERVMSEAGINAQDINVVLLASEMTPAFFLRLLDSFHDNLRRGGSSFSYLLNLYIIYHVLAHKLRLPQVLEGIFSARLIRQKLKQLHITASVVTAEHHYAHAASAYYTSGFKEGALVITVDAMGDALSVTVNVGKGNEIKRIFSQSGFSAISTYYSRLTEFLGFRPLNHEGKITSLAGYGRFNQRINELARMQLHFAPRRKAFNFTNHFFKEGMNDRLHRELKKYTREDVAYNFQHNFEQQIVSFVEFWIGQTGIHDIALAGGVFANVSLNQKISQHTLVNKLYIFAHMGDGGLALGAALSYFKPAPFFLKGVYWGCAYNNEDIHQAIDGTGLCSRLMEEGPLCDKISDLLFQGKTVAHFNARMEYGPRALGNRSILYRADDTAIRQWLNEKLARSDFMPFAPVTLDSEAQSLYQGLEKIDYTVRFMNVAVDCSQQMREKCPGAVHLDGTARPQILHEEDNPRLHRILQAYKKIKGTSTIINTSFNRHEEPIVCSPEDAVKSFLECGLDYLVLNNFLIWQKTG